MGRQTLNVTVDTNVLVRSAVRDNESQARVADEILRNAPLVVITMPCLCEFVWVLERNYKFDREEIARSVELLCDAPNVSANRPTLEAGLKTLKAGGDFADGVIAFEGSWLGGETFVSFDKRAVALLAKQGQATRLLV
jgi:predicted nucleic-acid-binding protein